MDPNERNRDRSAVGSVSAGVFEASVGTAVTTLRYVFWSIPGMRPRATKRNVLVVLVGLLALGVVLSVALDLNIQQWIPLAP
ncbi:hypothetical protein [Halococcus hamelinensis]|uniref:Uncharacterized protein n=1 Tax=Halococcus hamelinensis 100A6 TaxID=1132509 RepID=M0M121_9EURY|nr:hypothetical protein [Halococcus hamelinensis]EMA38065.1 hypothetical protein C447_11530 [Halococcus hamelinensis 100A6]